MMGIGGAPRSKKVVGIKFRQGSGLQVPFAQIQFMEELLHNINRLLLKQRFTALLADPSRHIVNDQMAPLVSHRVVNLFSDQHTITEAAS
jgi:hypothetical protein